MKDEKIIELFFARDEQALRETQEKYGGLCFYIASSFLTIREDREECVNDSLLALWNSIPPEKPESFTAYLSEVVRRQAINKSRENNAWKRGRNIQIVGDEFLSLVDDGTDLAAEFEARRAGEIINRILRGTERVERNIFIWRYWLGMTVPQISKQTGYGESRVKMILHRMRKRIAAELGKEGITR